METSLGTYRCDLNTGGSGVAEGQSSTTAMKATGHNSSDNYFSQGGCVSVVFVSLSVCGQDIYF